MPSVTTWTRLEPRPRARSISASLAARVRDPEWMLARQWQVGEFRGEDAGAAAFVQLAATISKFTGWRVKGETGLRSLPSGDPLEDLVESEPFTADLALRAELGEIFETLLARILGSAGQPVEETRAAVRQAYPLPSPTDTGEAQVTVGQDYAKELDSEPLVSRELVDEFARQGVPLSEEATVEVVVEGALWRIHDPAYMRRYLAQWSSEDTTISFRLHAPEIAGDPEAMRFLEVCAGRSLDGVAIYAASSASRQILPAEVPGVESGAVEAAADDLRRWVIEVYGDVGVTDPPAWKPARLEYDLEVSATTADGGTAVLAADPGGGGAFDWFTFDLRSLTRGSERTESMRFSVLPGQVRFRGMPNARWWEFEAGTTPFGEVQPDRRDVAKLVLMDFMLVHGNDWFMLPLEQPPGSLCHVDTLIVRDVFGVETLVERAGTERSQPEERWTMFTIAIEGQAGEVADFFLLPPSAASAVQAGATVEEAWFLRDEMANLVWAVEQTTENGIGEPWPGQERYLARGRERPDEVPTTSGPTSPLRYLLQTSVPENWFPFLPVAIDPAAGEIALERSLLTRRIDGRTEDVLPAGRILRPASLTDGTYRVFEEEVPREGVRVTRAAMRSRWIDGSTHLWIARRKSVGSGQGSSGLRFDLALPAGVSLADLY